MRKNILLSVLVAASLCSCGETVGQADTAEKTTGTTTETTATESAATTSETTKATSKTTTKTTSKKDVRTDVPDSVIISVPDNVEVFEDVTIDGLVNNSDIELINGDTLIDTSELGRKSTEIMFEYDGETYKKNINYTVADTTEPLVLNSGWNPYTLLGQPFDINSVVGFVDNYDRTPSVTYTGDVDTSAVGAYPISVTVTDSSGNFTSWDMTVFVVNDIPPPQDDNDRVEFKDFVKRYSYFDNVSFGIDVSAWQTYVNYDEVKKSGVEFVIMRMGYCYSSIYMDDYYYSNIENATNAGLDVGVYFYTTANSEEKAREQAQWIIQVLDGRKLDFPVAFDWEEWGSFQEYGMNLNDINEVYYAFCDELEKAGYSGMLYSSKNFLETVWQNKIDSPVWLAHFVDETNYTGDYSIWQASAYGRIDGIVGDVDMNIRYN